MTGKVVVNRAMSLDGFVAGPDDSMDWVFEYATPDQVPDVMVATGAMLCGRRTYDVGQRDAGKLSGDAYGGLWSGPVFVLTLPVLLGRGTPLLAGAGLDRVNLEPISSTASAGVTAMRFRVVEPCSSSRLTGQIAPTRQLPSCRG